MPPDPRHALIERSLSGLRAFRTPIPRDLGIADDVRAMKKTLERREAAIGVVARAWAKTIPHDIGAEAELVGVQRGVLSIRIRSAARRHALDRFLAAGGLARLRQACPVAISRVRFLR